MKQFDYSLNYEELDLRKQPELYTVGRGEQGVLMVEPYKARFCRTGGSKHPRLRQSHRRRSMNYFGI